MPTNHSRQLKANLAKSKRRKFKPDLRIPICLAESSLVSYDAKFLYAVMRSYAWYGKNWCNPSRETLAQHLGICKATISKYVAELKKYKVIEVKRRFNKSSVYVFPNYSQKIGSLLRSKVLTLNIVRNRGDLPWRGRKRRYLTLVRPVRDRPERRELAVLRKHGIGGA
jgi:hypothetical protein